MHAGLLELGQGDLVLPLHGLDDLLLCFVERREALVPGVGDRSLQGRIHLARRVEEARRALAQGAPDLAESAPDRLGDLFPRQVGDELVVGSLHRLGLQAELLQDLLHLPLQERRREAGMDHGHADPVGVEEGGKLRVIGHLPGAGHVAHHREHGALHHGPEEHVGAQDRGVGLNASQDLVPIQGEPGVTKMEAPVVPVDPLPSFGTLEEEVHPSLQDGDLDRIARLLQAGRRPGQEGLVLAGGVELAEEHRTGVLLHQRVRGVHPGQGQRRQQPGHETTKPPGEGAPRRVALLEEIQERRAEVGLRQEGLERLPGRLQALTELHPVDGTAVPFRHGHLDPPQLVVQVDKVGVARLLPVVVLGRHPEEGEDGALEELLEGVGQRDCGERLVEGVERSPEEGGLLPRGHHEPSFRHDALQTLPGGVARDVDCLRHGLQRRGIEPLRHLPRLLPVGPGIGPVAAVERRHGLRARHVSLRQGVSGGTAYAELCVDLCRHSFSRVRGFSPVPVASGLSPPSP